MIDRRADVKVRPPEEIRAPEQCIEDRSFVYDAFKADVYNLGKTLELRWLLCHVRFSNVAAGELSNF